MNRMIRSFRATLGKALVLCALALTLIVTPSSAFDPQEPNGAEQQRQRHHDELTFTQIDVPGTMLTRAQGINDRGQIVGGYIDAGGTEHGFLLDPGRFTTINVPGALQTQLLGINNHGQIVGAYQDAKGTPHGVLVGKGAFTPIDPPGAFQTTAVDLNDPGQIVGFFRVPGDVQ